ncbi:hypothetical protein ACFY5A_14940 [Microbacterium sp. NPDC012755]|uniref:hypothetical protein n=1 Tax=Microbacterium sp. NPDC012755 TaxID=3364184 RepID=UPI0036D1963F
MLDAFCQLPLRRGVHNPRGRRRRLELAIQLTGGAVGLGSDLLIVGVGLADLLVHPLVVLIDAVHFTVVLVDPPLVLAVHAVNFSLQLLLSRPHFRLQLRGIDASHHDDALSCPCHEE